MIPDFPRREAAVRLTRLLFVMDTYMSKREDAQLGWVEISCALGLASTKGKSVSKIASELKVTKQSISKGSTKFLRMSQLPPALGMKSAEARRTYMRTNGRHDHSE